MEFQRYFQSFADYFWEWDNQIFSSDSVFETITIPNGPTIAYEKFVFEILEHLSQNSIPPFGTLLLAIIATNHDSDQAIAMIDTWAKSREISKTFPVEHSFRLGAAIGFMKQLSALPDDYKSGEKRLKLFQTIFEECHNRISSDRAEKILDEYKNHRHHLVRASVKEEFNEANFIKDFRTLAMLKVRFPKVQSILNAMEGVPYEDLKDKLEEEILEEKNLSDSADFVEELIQDDRTFQVGSLIRRLWSGLHIPLHHNHPSEQPMGGISDLTNKGDFDKLVISEFAYDDDVFMSRIANNEALYIQREVPPEADKFERILLIDVSLKNWGNPKILSYASAIAIARHPKTDIKCRIFVVGQDFKQVSLENVHEVINALGELSIKLDCSIGINSFFQQNEISSKNQEVFLFSSEESLKLAPMQKVLSEYFSEIKYVFEMEMESIKIYKNQNKGRKMLLQIIMPLDELWYKEKKDLPRKTRDTSIDKIPLLYPVERNYKNIFHDGKDYYMYINRSLFLFTDTDFNKGLKKIASNLPFGDGVLAIKINSNGQKLFLCFYHDREQNVSIMNLDTQELKNGVLSYSELSGTKITAFEFSGEFYLTDDVSYLKIHDDLKTEYADRDVVKEAFLNYTRKRTSFIDNFMKSKFKYSVIKRIKGFSIVNNRIEVNGFDFVHLEFSKKHYYYAGESGDVSIRFDEKVNLILKNRGESFLDLVKVIKENTGQSLVKSKEIVEDELGVVLNNVTRENAEELKKIIESKGAVCYIETLFFESKDGSKVTNKDGILIFESSNDEIPKFYIPFIIDGRTVMATEIEYSGNDYFISDSVMESIKEKEFMEKYIEPFIHNIKQHGT
ncbi:ribosomal protein L7/L12 [Flavobacterium sp. HJJ]|uniref:ribosomal protein L7/L12 n=1 Tax=Flavobacterium sp. HJJ TaxID=2783792 RepID=UPI00188C688A|nr:ribosomal protein L7/L12 [Flavobacterium sp. HJJ]MBF4469819.1 ribosomal protein L7/L12 [Flavobacterium sp. HJJ]